LRVFLWRSFPKRSGAFATNRTTTGFEGREDLVRRLRIAAPGVVEEMAVPLEHHPRIRVPQTAGDCQRVFARLDEQRVRGTGRET
jgi:hypothetical protein